MFCLAELPVAVQEEAARDVACRLLARLGNADRNDPDVWAVIAKDMDCDVERFFVPNGSHGQYCPAGWEGGIIQLNGCHPLHVQARIICHELAHNELHYWKPPRLWSYADLYCWAGERTQMRHEMARRVEIIIFGEAITNDSHEHLFLTEKANLNSLD